MIKKIVTDESILEETVLFHKNMTVYFENFQFNGVVITIPQLFFFKSS